jgi:hypothetical protein
MPFTSETAIYGGKKPGAGRPKGDPVKKAAAQIAREYIEQHIQPLMETYVGLAAGQIVKRISEAGEESFELKVDPATTRHAIDKLLPDDHNATTQPTAIIHQFIQFGASDPNTIQLSAEGLSSPVLGGDDAAAQEAGGDDLAPAKRQGQDSIEFSSFANVPGKRR